MTPILALALVIWPMLHLEACCCVVNDCGNTQAADSLDSNVAACPKCVAEIRTEGFVGNPSPVVLPDHCCCEADCHSQIVQPAVTFDRSRDEAGTADVANATIFSVNSPACASSVSLHDVGVGSFFLAAQDRCALLERWRK